MIMLGVEKKNLLNAQLCELEARLGKVENKCTTIKKSAHTIHPALDGIFK